MMIDSRWLLFNTLRGCIALLFFVPQICNARQITHTAEHQAYVISDVSHAVVSCAQTTVVPATRQQLPSILFSMLDTTRTAYCAMLTRIAGMFVSVKHEANLVSSAAMDPSQQEENSVLCIVPHCAHSRRENTHKKLNADDNTYYPVHRSIALQRWSVACIQWDTERIFPSEIVWGCGIYIRGNMDAAFYSIASFGTHKGA